MRRRVRPSFLLLALLGRVCCAQNTGSFEFRIPDNIRPESVLIRYVVSGDDFGGWVKTQAGVSAYRVATGTRRTASIRAILYAPGCEIDTVDFALQGASAPSHTFVCRPLRTVRIDGRIANPPEWMRDAQLQAKYIARWAPGFLGIAQEVPLTIALGDRTPLNGDGRFQIAIPNFSADSRSHYGAGELQIWAVDRASGASTAHLIPEHRANSGDRTGSLKMDSEYPAEVLFDVCSVGRPPLHLVRRDGFVIRGDDRSESCAH